MFCKECGAPNQDDNYCRFCGAAIALVMQPRAVSALPFDSVVGPTPQDPLVPETLYAGWSSRLAAAALDGFVFVVAVGLPLLGFAVAYHPGIPFSRMVGGTQYLCPTGKVVAWGICNQVYASNGMSFFAKFLLTSAVVLGALWLLAYVRSVGRRGRGATFGMSFVGIEVAREKNHHNIGNTRAAIRLLVTLVLTATVVGVIFDLMWPLIDSKRRTLHDLAVGAVVLDVNRPAGV